MGISARGLYGHTDTGSVIHGETTEKVITAIMRRPGLDVRRCGILLDIVLWPVFCCECGLLLMRLALAGEFACSKR